MRGEGRREGEGGRGGVMRRRQESACEKGREERRRERRERYERERIRE